MRAEIKSEIQYVFRELYEIWTYPNQSIIQQLDLLRNRRVENVVGKMKRREERKQKHIRGMRAVGINITKATSPSPLK